VINSTAQDRKNQLTCVTQTHKYGYPKLPKSSSCAVILNRQPAREYGAIPLGIGHSGTPASSHRKLSLAATHTHTSPMVLKSPWKTLPIEMHVLRLGAAAIEPVEGPAGLQFCRNREIVIGLRAVRHRTLFLLRRTDRKTYSISRSKVDRIRPQQDALATPQAGFAPVICDRLLPDSRLDHLRAPRRAELSCRRQSLHVIGT